MKSGNKKTVLLVEDDRNTRNGIAKLLRNKYEITIAEDGLRGLNILKKNNFDVVLTDIQMPGANGMDILSETLKKDTPPPCILITAYGTIETAVNAMKAGAYDFISKPVDIDRLEIIFARALESSQLKEENLRLKKQLDKKFGIENIIGESIEIQNVFDMVRQIAPAKSTVLITGESGTGKELIAQAIHQLSGRKGQFIPVHCAALPANLLESELFGHEKGSFTGASEQRIGRFESADGGTIFLDEIGEIDLSVQVKLLRVLETKSFERVGGNNLIETDTRIVTATNRDLHKMVAEGKFREDLYFRLNVLNIELPPLRSRKADIPLLIKTFVDFYSAENGKKSLGISEDVLKILSSYNWPGNIRELRNCIERMVVLCRDDKLNIINIPFNIRESLSAELKGDHNIAAPSTLNLESNEKKLIIHALDECDGNRTAAAVKLGISRRTLHRKLNEYNIS